MLVQTFLYYKIFENIQTNSFWTKCCSHRWLPRNWNILNAILFDLNCLIPFDAANEKVWKREKKSRRTITKKKKTKQEPSIQLIQESCNVNKYESLHRHYYCCRWNGRLLFLLFNFVVVVSPVLNQLHTWEKCIRKGEKKISTTKDNSKIIASQSVNWLSGNSTHNKNKWFVLMSCASLFAEPKQNETKQHRKSKEKKRKKKISRTNKQPNNRLTKIQTHIIKIPWESISKIRNMRIYSRIDQPQKVCGLSIKISCSGEARERERERKTENARRLLV